MAGDAAGETSLAPVLPETPYNYADPPLPAHFRALAELDSTPADDPVTNDGATLGRVLFYDRQLSRNGLVSCASCHNQRLGFDDSSRFSIGFDGRITKRSAMPLVNGRYNPRRAWFRDERAPSLEEQAMQVIHDPLEMGLAPGELVKRIAARPWYRELFRKAFGDDQITAERAARALAHFVRSMVTFTSRYDFARARVKDPLEPFPLFSAIENRGKDLFLRPVREGGAGCGQCHQGEAFLMLEPRNNGLDRKGGDAGLAIVTGRIEDRGRMRAASLRNIAVRPPFMHDGRFNDLDAVLRHYSAGIAADPNLSPELRAADGAPLRLALTAQDRAALIAFLETLTDEPFLTDPKFSDPFRPPDAVRTGPCPDSPECRHDAGQ